MATVFPSRDGYMVDALDTGKPKGKRSLRVTRYFRDKTSAVAYQMELRTRFPGKSIDVRLSECMY